MLNLNYDKRFDVLYILFSDTNNTYGEEDDFGVVIHRDFDTDEVTCITIFDFKKKLNANQLSKLALPVDIDYANDVVPLIHS
jgi:uncharacterized protein YuzE